MNHKLLFGLVLSFMLLTVSGFAVLNDAYVAYSFDDDDLTGSDPLDVSGNGLTANNNGATTGASGLLKQAFDYDGANDYINRSDNLFTGNEGTIVYFINFDTISNFDWLAQQGDSNTDRSFDFFFTTGPKLKVAYSTSSSGSYNTEYTQTGTFSTSGWTMIAFVRNGTNHTLWINGSQEPWTLTAGSATSSNYRNPTTDGWRLYGRDGGSNSIDGRGDMTMYYNRALTGSELADIWNSGAGLNPYASFVVSAQEYFDNASLTNFSADVSITNSSGTFYYNKTTTNGSIEYDEFDSGTIINITVKKDGYAVNDTRLNYDSGTSLTARLSESQVTVNASSVITNATVNNFNVTILGNIYAGESPINITAGTYNFSFSKDGWFNKTQSINITANTTQNRTINNVYDSLVNISFFEAVTNETANSVSFFINNTGLGYSLSANTGADNTYNFTTLQGLQFNLSVVGGVYNPDVFPFTVSNMTQNESFEVQLLNSLVVSVFDINMNELITSTNTTLQFTNSTHQFSQEINGTGVIENLTDGSSYVIKASASGYDNLTYNLVYDSSVGDLDLYLTPAGSLITFDIIDALDNPLENARLEVFAFVNGTSTKVGDQETNIIGRVSFFLNTTQTHSFRISKSGFITQNFVLASIDETSYTIKMQEQTLIDFESAFSNIIYNYEPNNSTLTPTVNNFIWTVTATDSDLEYFSIQLFDENNTLINSVNSSIASGGVLNLTQNLLTYNDTVVLAQFQYKKAGYGVVLEPHSYYITDQSYLQGSLKELRYYMINNVSIGMRIVLWTILFGLFALVLSVAIRGVANAAITVSFGMVLAWVFGMSLFSVGLLGGVILFSLAAAVRGEFV